MTRQELRQKAIELRLQGLTYREIREFLGENVPKGTMSGWLKDIKIELRQEQTIQAKKSEAVRINQRLAVQANREKREEYLQRVRDSNEYLLAAMQHPTAAKIAITMLYLGEGGKSIKAGAVKFGNSNPKIVLLFLKLLRICYTIDETCFRCRIRHRADQDPAEMLEFWSGVTGIPKTRFYRSYADRRTAGVPTQKIEYKGVCNVTYLSAAILHDLLAYADIIMGH